MCLKSEQAFESFFGQAGMSLPSAILYAKSCSKFNLFTLPSMYLLLLLLLLLFIVCK